MPKKDKGKAHPLPPEPMYPHPPANRVEAATAALRTIEQYIAPGSVVFATVLIRALIARAFTVGEAMWAVYMQICGGRYFACQLAKLPSSVRQIVGENRNHPPVAGGGWPATC
jgi:hypothetical protein